ncbi:MAG: SNF2-related protein [Limnochordia bacterium]|jgi:superfamily II DNA or RNA helicase
MARTAFAKTWWGRVWVEALERIDSNTNRLPRGRTYARNGSVLRVDLVDHRITAEVQGRRHKPYQVKIKLKQFSKAQLRRLLELLENNPAIGAQLELGQVPEELLSITEEWGLSLLPQSWEDMQASCSCPDWANPCKHLAAVYYSIAGEIDKNPLLLLQLRGVTPELLQGRIPLIDPRPLRNSFLPLEEVFLVEEPVERPAFVLRDSHGQSRLEMLQGEWISPETGQLKNKLRSAYKNIAQEVRSLELHEFKSDQEDGLRLFYAHDPDDDPLAENYLAVVFGNIQGEGFPISLLMPEGNQLHYKDLSVLQVEIDKILDFFLHGPLLHREEGYRREMVFFSHAAAVSLLLAEHWMYFPEVVYDQRGNFWVHFIPVLHTEESRQLQAYLEKIYPQELICHFFGHGVLSPQNGVWEILTLFLTRLVHLYHGLTIENELEEVFFEGSTFTVSHYNEDHLALAIRNWLTSAALPQTALVPILKLEPTGDDSFNLGLFIRSKDHIFGEELPASKAMETTEPLFGRPPGEIKGELIRQLTIAQRYFPPLETFIKESQGIILDGAEVAKLLGDSAQILQLLGIQVILPRELVSLAKPRIQLKGSPADKHKSFIDLEGLLEFDWQVALGDTSLDEDEFRELAKSAGKVVRYQDQYIFLEPEATARILERLAQPIPRLSSREFLQGALTGMVQGVEVALDKDAQRLIDGLLQVERIPVPQGLRGELRSYQLEGYRWATTRLKHGFGCCLADDMGLGKTIQAIAVILRYQEEQPKGEPVLIICPTSLLNNWERELRRFAPSLNTLIFHGQGRRLSARGKDVVITTYATARQDRARIQRRRWGLVILDEAQNIKNPETQQTKAITGLKAGGFLALTGTPVENRLRELWSIFQILLPGYFGTLKEFNDSYGIPIEKYNREDVTQRLQKAVAPFILRRMKTDESIVPDLPAKIVEEEYCTLTKEQAALYQGVIDEMLARIEETEGINRRGLVLKLLTSLKQICNHPMQYTKQGSAKGKHSGKSLRTLELIQNFWDNKEKVLLFTQYREMASILESLIRDELALEPLVFHGGLNRAQREDIVNQFKGSSHHPVLIISLRAGGTGLNLTEATGVIHYDLWWNPAVENQATDRAYRIGQWKAVTVKRLITLGTFEEKINDMLSEKQKMADLILTKETALSELSNQQLRELLSLSLGS